MSKRDELLFLQDILDSVNAIFEFTDGLDTEKFSQNRLVHSATIREFEAITSGKAGGLKIETAQSDLIT